MIQVSSNIRFMRIFAGFPKEGVFHKVVYSHLATYLSAIRSDPIGIGSLIIVTIGNVVFANKSRKLECFWMTLGRGLRAEKTKPYTFPAKSRYRFRRFGERAKNGSQTSSFL